MISTDGFNFEIIFTANFLVSSHAFSANDKMIQFNIESGLEEENIGEIVIPRDLIDGEFTILLDGEEISYKINKTNRSSVIVIEFDGKGGHTLEIIATKYLEVELEKSNGGGCLIATAAFGSELAPQVQQLRELRDNTVLQTESGSAFLTGFNHFYYSFSPAVADYERENPAFKKAVKLTLAPLLTSLTLLQYADIDSESEMLGYGIGIILLNIGMYFVAPAVLIMIIRKRV
ncbi:MAG TPA: peptidylprolyl isomerase [Flavobacteriales bacterium]|nr:peptidylprolyl isomerase [Flavobacteriales bacterium]